MYTKLTKEIINIKVVVLVIVLYFFGINLAFAERISIGQMASRCVKQVIYVRENIAPCKKISEVTKSTVKTGVGETIEYSPSWRAHIVGEEEDLTEELGYYDTFLNQNFSTKYKMNGEVSTDNLSYNQKRNIAYFDNFDVLQTVETLIYEIVYEKPPYGLADIDLSFLPKTFTDYEFDLRPLFEFVYLLVDITNYFKAELSGLVLSVNETYQILAQRGRLSCGTYDLSSGMLDCERVANVHRLTDKSSRSNNSLNSVGINILSHKNKLMSYEYEYNLRDYERGVGDYIAGQVTLKIKSRSSFTQAGKFAINSSGGTEVTTPLVLSAYNVRNENTDDRIFNVNKIFSEISDSYDEIKEDISELSDALEYIEEEMNIEEEADYIEDTKNLESNISPQIVTPLLKPLNDDEKGKDTDIISEKAWQMDGFIEKR